MKTKFLWLLLVLALPMAFTSCEEQFDYPMSTLYGTWEAEEVLFDDGWCDITIPMYDDLQFSITFYKDGTYYGAGYFGYGKGTYTAKGSTIQTYYREQPFYKYEVISLHGDVAHLKMISPKNEKDYIEFKARKQ